MIMMLNNDDNAGDNEDYKRDATF